MKITSAITNLGSIFAANLLKTSKEDPLTLSNVVTVTATAAEIADKDYLVFVVDEVQKAVISLK